MLLKRGVWKMSVNPWSYVNVISGQLERKGELLLRTQTQPWDYCFDI